MNKPIVLDYPPRGCAVCGSSNTRALYSQRFVTMSDGSLFSGYDVVACDECGHCYADHLPSQEAFDRYYRDMSKYEMPTNGLHSGPSEHDVARFKLLAGKFQRCMPNRTAKLLEIGCATGLLLSELRDAGYRDVLGLDPSPMCARVANDRYGVKVITGVVSDTLPGVGPVDVLLLIGVMEHIRDLHAALTKMSDLLEPGGKVVIVVPDASMYAEGDDAPFQEFSMEHINFFGPGCLSNLMARRGFSTLLMEQGMQPGSADTVTPVLFAVFEKLPAGHSLPWEKDCVTAAGLDRYIAKSIRDDSVVQHAISALADSRRPIIIWGAGTHTLRLLATSRLAEANLVAFVDSNPRYQGKSINGLPIVGPAAVAGMDGAILISSRPAQHVIQRAIVDVLRLPNEVITLYRRDQSTDRATLGTDFN